MEKTLGVIFFCMVIYIVADTVQYGSMSYGIHYRINGKRPTETDGI